MRQAVLLSCHGTVERVEDIPAFVTRIRRGRPAPPDVVEEVTRRFEAIGGSPLMRITHAQAAALEERIGVPVRAAARLAPPYPEEVLSSLHGIDRLVSLPLAPQSVHVYHPPVRRAAEPLGMDVVEAPLWGSEPRLVAAFANAIERARARMDGAGDVALVLTAHSLPKRVIDAGDPYEKDFRAMAEAVTAEVDRRGMSVAQTAVAYQSQGMSGGEWLGPDLETSFRRLFDAGARRLLVAPIGFLAEHVETLYDIDVEARELAEQIGFSAFERMDPMNDRNDFIDALEAVARRLLAA